jgi:hypothetical protein
LRAVQNFRNADLSEIKIMQAEVAQIVRNKVLEQRLAALVAKENFVADKNVAGTQFASRDFYGKLFRWSKATASAARFVFLWWKAGH